MSKKEIPFDKDSPEDKGKKSTAHRSENGSNETQHQIQGDAGKTIKPESQRKQ